MGYDEDEWFDATLDPDCPFIEHPVIDADNNLPFLQWLMNQAAM